MTEHRDQQIHFRVSKVELERIRQKMESCGILSIGSYLRKMALDGYCLNLDLLFLQEQKISSADELKELADAALSHYHELGDSIKAAEQRMTEIAVLRAHIVNYAKTRPVYDAYRKSGYSSKFLEAHREEITLHKTAKAAFNESGLKKLPKVKDLNAEYSALLTMKKALYPEYRKARDEMQEIVKAQKNVELFFAEEKDSKQVEQIR